MKAIAVHPGTPNSMHLREVDEPRLEDVPGGRGVLVEVLRVGVDGTDKEINAAEYGDAPDGDDFLITGHESLGRVIAVGDDVPSHIAPGTIVVASVRRPGMSLFDAIGLQDMTTDDVYFERGINKRHGYLCERYVEDWRYITPLPSCLSETGVLLEPLTVAEKAIAQAFEIQRRIKVWEPRRAAVLGSGTVGLLATLVLRLRGIEVTCISLPKAPYRNSELIEEIGGTYVSTQDMSVAEAAAQHGPFDIVIECTGFSPLVWDGAQALAKNGVLVLVSVTGGDRSVEIPSDHINQAFVLGNKVMVGSVNASPEDFARGRDDLVKAYAFYPGWLEQLLTTPIEGLENHEQMIRELTDNREAIKVFVQVASRAGAGSSDGAAAVGVAA